MPWEIEALGMLAAGQAVNGLADAHLLLEPSEHHHAAPSAEHRDEETVVAPRAAEGDGARGVAAEPVGDEPLVPENVGRVGRIARHPPEIGKLGTTFPAAHLGAGTLVIGGLRCPGSVHASGPSRPSPAVPPEAGAWPRTSCADLRLRSRRNLGRSARAEELVTEELAAMP